MKYKDLNLKHNQNRNGNKISLNPKSNNKSNQGSILIKTLLGIVSLTVIFFGLKLLISPVVSAVAGFLQDSTTSISYFLSQQEIRQDNGMTNILLLGVDTRAEGGATLTDTIIIASLRHTDNQITLVSLPRDLWVNVPAFGNIGSQSTKINSVYSIGEQYNYPGGGIALLRETLSSYLAIPIHYHVKVGFDGFEKFVDAVDGVDIYVEQAFVDYQYPRAGFEAAPWSERWEVVSFEQGWQHMDGETALKYARSRHALGPEGSDFARARRQQKVILALKEKTVSSETLFNVNRIKELYVAFADEVETDVGLAEIPTMYETAKSIGDFSQVATYVLNNDGSQDDGLLYTPNPEDFGGAFVLLPREGWESVQNFVKDALFHTDTTENAEETEQTEITPAL